MALQAEIDKLQGQLRMVAYYAPLAYKMATAGDAKPPLDMKLARYAAGVTAVRETLQDERAKLVRRMVADNNWTRQQWVDAAALLLTLTESACFALGDPGLFPPIE
jgi:hypothetical protein